MAEKTTKKKDGRGGARPGAGRPKNGSKLYSFRAPEHMAREIDNAENRTEFLRECMEIALEAKAGGNLKPETGEALNLMVEAEGLLLPQIGVYDTGLPVACGIPTGIGDVSHMELTNLSSMLVPQDHPAVVCRVSGESMIGAHMFEGDIVLVDVSPRVPSEKEVALCELNGEYTFKYIRRHDDKVWLVPDNPAFKEREVRPGEDDFHVRGIAKSVVRIL